jgi:hypothetical protein
MRKKQEAFPPTVTRPEITTPEEALKEAMDQLGEEGVGASVEKYPSRQDSEWAMILRIPKMKNELYDVTINAHTRKMGFRKHRP